MVPLRITATTPHGVVLSRPWGIAFDGLLASVLWHRRKSAAHTTDTHLTYHHDQPPEPLDLPLARCGDPNLDATWHWMATFADLHPRSHNDTDPDIRWRTSRTDRQRLQHLTPIIGKHAVSDSIGRYQRRIIPVMAHPASNLTWRAVGDPDAIRDLLTNLPSIGKHRSVGEGIVTQWEVCQAPDLQHWEAGHEHEPGILGRTIPRRCIDQATTPINEVGPPGVSAIRPPYLHPASRTDSIMPAR